MRVVYDFRDCLKWEKEQWDLAVELITNRRGGNYQLVIDEIRPAALDEDKQGTDAILSYVDGTTERIQFKFRSKVYEDVLFEDHHKFDDGRIQPGWINKPSTAELICYVFVPERRGLWYSWPKLQAAWTKNNWLWRSREKYYHEGYVWLPPVKNKGYESMNLTVPIQEVNRAVSAIMI